MNVRAGRRAVPISNPDKVLFSRNGINDAPTLVYLAGQNVVTVHVWPAKADRPRQPDRDFDAVRTAAHQVGDAPRAAGLVPTQ